MRRTALRTELEAAGKAEAEAAVERHLTFIDQLLADKDELARRCAELAASGASGSCSYQNDSARAWVAVVGGVGVSVKGEGSGDARVDASTSRSSRRCSSLARWSAAASPSR